MYTRKLLKWLKIDNYNPIRLLIPVSTVLKPNIKSPLKYNNVMVYRQIISSIIYLLNYTCPNISYTIDQLAKFMAVLKESHYYLSKQLL